MEYGYEIPLKIGSKVRVLTEEEGSPKNNWGYSMDQYMGQILTVKNVSGDHSAHEGVRVEENSWFWNYENIVPVVTDFLEKELFTLE